MNEEKRKIISDICPFYKEYGSCEQCNTELEIDDPPCYFECMANAIINNNYRKQSEGEWLKVYQNKKATVYECSNCKHLTFGTCDYCICGAKMKGGEK